MISRRFAYSGMIALVAAVASAAAVGAALRSEPFSFQLPPAPSTNYLLQVNAANPAILTTSDVGELDLSVRAGDFIDFGGIGVGALAGADGEFVLLGPGDGWMSDPSGNVTRLTDETELLYFAVMSGFEATGEIDLDGVGCMDDISTIVEDLNGPDNLQRMTLFRIDADFDELEFVYSDPFEEEALTLEGISGTMVGTESATFVTGITTEAYGSEFGLSEYPWHLHFVSADRTVVGHVTDCKIATGSLQYALVDTYDIRLPYSGVAVAPEDPARRTFVPRRHRVPTRTTR